VIQTAAETESNRTRTFAARARPCGDDLVFKTNHLLDEAE
jgi:hypothetical protein